MVLCPFCAAVMPQLCDALTAGWFPTYWIGETEVFDPFCPGCAPQHLIVDADGEYCLREPGKPEES